MTPAERGLALTLRILALPMLLAIPCASLPVAWMDATHQWLGLGPLPHGPIVEYLARSSSLLYGFRGILLLLVASDIRRYLPLIGLMGGAGLAFGFAMFWIDCGAGLPGYWSWLEAGLIVAESSLLLFLTWRANAAIQAAPPAANPSLKPCSEPPATHIPRPNRTSSQP